VRMVRKYTSVGLSAARARFNKTDKEIRKDVFLALPIAGRSP
jgi:hypothetical protein